MKVMEDDEREGFNVEKRKRKGKQTRVWFFVLHQDPSLFTLDKTEPDVITNPLSVLQSVVAAGESVRNTATSKRKKRIEANTSTTRNVRQGQRERSEGGREEERGGTSSSLLSTSKRLWRKGGTSVASKTLTLSCQIVSDSVASTLCGGHGGCVATLTNRLIAKSS